MAQSLVRLMVLPALAAIAMSPASHAQARDEGGPAVLEEVVVRANCRAQNLQEVPMSVSAFTEDFFRYSGVRTLDSLDAYTPSLRVQTRTDSRSISIRIRGIGSTGINSGISIPASGSLSIACTRDGRV